VTPLPPMTRGLWRGRTRRLGTATLLGILVSAVLLSVPLPSPGSMLAEAQLGSPLLASVTGFQNNSTGLSNGTDFTAYLGGYSHWNHAGPQGAMNATNAVRTQLLWNVTTGGSVMSQPIVVNSTVYVGSGDGYEYALSATTGALVWKTFLGVAPRDAPCDFASLGVSSTASYVGGRLYVNAGNSTLYALNSTTGRVVWHVAVGASTAPGQYLWASPLVYNHSAYIGIASQCGQPLVPGGLDRVYLSNQTVGSQFNASSPDPNGSGIWSTPSLNPTTNTIFVTTGASFSPTNNSTYSDAVIALNANDLNVTAHWQVPASEVIAGDGFGATPTLFDLTDGTPVVVAENKNGDLYEWDQSNLTLRWEQSIGTRTGDLFSGSFFDNHLYIVGIGLNQTGVAYNSSVESINPATGKFEWRTGFNNTAHAGYGAPLEVGGLLVVPIGNTLYFLNSTNGSVVYRSSPGGVFVAPASVSRGEVFAGAGHGVYAYDIALNWTPVVGARTGPAPLTANFSVTVTGGVPPYAYDWSFGDGNASTLASGTHTYTRAGDFLGSLTVSDATGRNLTMPFLVDVTGSSAPPAAAGGLSRIELGAIGLGAVGGTVLVVLYLWRRRQRSRFPPEPVAPPPAVQS
jgi:outer membrane protein assembly factor BamB